MKNLKLFSFLLILSIGSKAQTTDSPGQSNGFIGVLGGMTMPSGNWTKVAYNDNTSGYAGNGTIFGIEGAYFFSKYVGIGGMVSYSTFNFKGLDSLSAGYQNSFDVDKTTTSVNGGYSMWTFMPGLYLRYPFSDKFSVNAKVLAGFTSTTTPTITCDVFDGGRDDGNFIQQACTANSFGYMAGIGVSYNVLSWLGINLHANYLSCQPDFYMDNINRPANVGRLITEYNQPLGAMSFTLGVAYIFTKK